MPNGHLGETQAVVDDGGPRDVGVGAGLVVADRHEPGRGLAQERVGPGQVEAAVERRDDRDRTDAREQQVRPLEVAVDEVELVRAGKDLVQGQLHVGQRVAGVAERSEGLGNGLDVPARDHRIAAGEGRDLVAATVELGRRGRARSAPCRHTPAAARARTAGRPGRYAGDGSSGGYLGDRSGREGPPGRDLAASVALPAKCRVRAGSVGALRRASPGRSPRLLPRPGRRHRHRRPRRRHHRRPRREVRRPRRRRGRRQRRHPGRRCPHRPRRRLRPPHRRSRRRRRRSRHRRPRRGVHRRPCRRPRRRGRRHRRPWPRCRLPRSPGPCRPRDPRSRGRHRGDDRA